jgi:hypothetical protein
MHEDEVDTRSDPVGQDAEDLDIEGDGVGAFDHRPCGPHHPGLEICHREDLGLGAAELGRRTDRSRDRASEQHSGRHQQGHDARTTTAGCSHRIHPLDLSWPDNTPVLTTHLGWRFHAPGIALCDHRG